MKIFNYIKNWYTTYKKNKLYNKKIKELKKRDPFSYKNF